MTIVHSNNYIDNL